MQIHASEITHFVSPIQKKIQLLLKSNGFVSFIYLFIYLFLCVRANVDRICKIDVIRLRLTTTKIIIIIIIIIVISCGAADFVLRQKSTRLCHHRWLSKRRDNEPQSNGFYRKRTIIACQKTSASHSIVIMKDRIISSHRYVHFHDQKRKLHQIIHPDWNA